MERIAEDSEQTNVSVDEEFKAEKLYMKDLRKLPVRPWRKKRICAPHSSETLLHGEK